MITLMKRLWPINRSITGEGLRQTLKMIQSHLPELKIYEVPSGTKVLDWEIPEEWEIKEAYLQDPDGQKIADFSKNNLHVVGYSTHVDGEFSLEELEPHLFSRPDMPNAIPYVTSYYNKYWGFCLPDETKKSLKPGRYKAYINAKHFKGSLSYGELLVKGKSEKEVFISTYCCHPSMANNELSGPCVATALADWVTAKADLKYTYRFVFAPETIGAAAYLDKHLHHLKSNVIAAFNLTCVGDERNWSYLPSRIGNSYTDRIAKHVLKHYTESFEAYTWSDRGSDEKMYCAPFVDLPMVSIMRSKHGTYPEYHTSLDTIGNVVTQKGLEASVEMHKQMINIIENNALPETTVIGEPQLGKRALYPNISHNRSSESVRARLDLISYADKKQTLLDIAEILDVPFEVLQKEAEILKKHEILKLHELDVFK